MNRVLTFSLGGLWLIDGILQLQPAMFTSAFVQQVLAPTLTGQSHWIAAIIAIGIRIASTNPFWFNVAAAGIQLLIGALLIFRFRPGNGGAAVQKFALWLSVAWALIIWVFGEGFSSLFTGSATFYTGAPGSALLYTIIALFLLDDMNEHRTSKNPLEKLPIVTGVIFLVGAVLQLMPMFWQSTMFSILGNFLAVAALATIGIFLILMPRSHTVGWIAIIFLAAVWWLGQAFGGIFSFPGGVATDPNSAVVMMLFLVPGLI